MICKQCQTELPDNARFCPACGALQPMICPSCGAESRPGSKTCSACGKKLPMADRTDRLIYPKRKKHPLRVAAILALVLAALLFLAAAVLFLTKTVDFSKPDPVQSTQEPAPEQSTEPEELPDPAENDNEPTGDAPSTEPDEPTEDEVPAEPDDPTEDEPAEPDEPVEEEPDEPTEDESEPPSTEPDDPVEAEPADTDYIFPDSSERLLTEADLQGLSAWELKIARNEIYARHGRRFNSQELQNYFDSRDWYRGTIDPASFTDEMLSDIELANVQLLKAAE